MTMTTLVAKNKFTMIVTICITLITFSALSFWLTQSEQRDDGKSIKELPFSGQFPIAKISGVEFEETVGFPPMITATHKRDYGLFLLLNTMAPEYGCSLCKEFEASLTKLCSMINANERLSRKIHFASMELKGNRELFVKMRAEQVPTLLFLPSIMDNNNNNAGKDYYKLVKAYDLRKGLIVENVSRFIEENSGITIKTANRSKLLVPILIGTALLVLVLSTAAATGRAGMKTPLGKSIISFFYHYKTWAILGLAFIILMTSGFMWVRIRGAPYVSLERNGGGGGGGKVNYFAPGAQHQLGVETQIVGFLNSLAAIATIALTSKVPRKFPNQIYRHLLLTLCMLTIFIAFGVEIALFKRKMSGYPFKLLFD